MKSLIIILASLGISFYFTDLDSSSALFSVLCPLVVFISLCSLLLWFVGKTGPGHLKREMGDASFFDSFGGGGGD